MKKHLILFLLLFAGAVAFSQTAATNTGTLYISGSSDIFYAAGDFTNNSGSSLTNNGQLHVKGNLSNAQSSMTIGTGTLYLVGTSAQALNGTQPFRTFNLNTNNSSGITLNNNLSVSGAHTFTAGVITTSATPNYLVYEAGSSHSGDGDTKHVNGWVKKFGSTNFIFPVGNGTYERTILLRNMSASSEFDVKYALFTPNPYTMVVPVYNVDDREYWSVTKVSGGNAVVELNWNFPKVYFPNYVVPDILVAGWNGSAWTDNGGTGTATGTTTTTGTAYSNSVSAFNLFTFGSRTYILPLSLISFNAIRHDDYTQVIWTTDKESATDHFNVERSDDGINFYSVSQVPARNSGVLEQYSARDNGAITHTVYYRLKIANNDGRPVFSKVIAVTVTTTEQLTLVINPVHDKITLQAGANLSGLFNYSLSAMDGKTVQAGQLSIQNNGQYLLPLQSQLTAGIYILQVRNGQRNFKFTVQVQ